MNIDITFAYPAKKILRKISKLDNHLYLMQGDSYHDEQFPLLCQIEPDDPTAFGPEDMDQFIKELNMVKQTLSDPENLAHIDEIIAMAQECKETPGSFIDFE